jgi:RHH-type proline utilization regulon transcriptional repressor/proline dehydrogenase/delta 1-pyrroline-5-carboxylate dehydrogenase
VRAGRTCANVGLTIDAEEVDRLELSLDVFEALAAQVAQHFPQWRGFGLALQAYQTRALPLIEHIIGLARRYRLRFMCRLVKGAYWDAEIKRAQELGLPHYPVFTHKHHTDVSYLACARALLAAPDAIYPQFATHNAGTIAAILQMAARPAGVDASGGNGGVGGRAFGAGQGGAREAGGGHGAERAASHPGFDPDSTSFQGASPRFELQRLHGMSEGTYREVLKNPLVACRVYAPVGAHRDLLAYLVRRLLENGANSSFVHQLADVSVALDELLVSPLHLTPNPSLPLPPDLFGPGRRNSAGLDLAVAAMRAPLLQALDTVQVPVVAEFDVKTAPSQRDLAQACYPAMEQACRRGGPGCTMLRSAADTLELQTAALLCPAGAARPSRPGGMRCRRYARRWTSCATTRARPSASTAPMAMPGPTGEIQRTAPGRRAAPGSASARGTFRWRSSWGRWPRRWRPATPCWPSRPNKRRAWRLEAVRLLHAAGVPGDRAAAACTGPATPWGAALVAAAGHRRGWCSPAPPQVARMINRALAAKDGPIVPLIAETGGINAMLVDSTALPEQVSGCGGAKRVSLAPASAARRLRLLCVHAEGIADGCHRHDPVAPRRELVAGDPADLATDVGPVIDRRGLRRASASTLQRLAREATPLLDDATCLIPSAKWSPGLLCTWFAPAGLRSATRSPDLQQEIFGPVLHIVRWSGDPAGRGRADQRAWGMASRWASRPASTAGRRRWLSAAHVGNVYINRNHDRRRGRCAALWWGRAERYRAEGGRTALPDAFLCRANGHRQYDGRRGQCGSCWPERDAAEAPQW